MHNVGIGVNYNSRPLVISVWALFGPCVGIGMFRLKLEIVFGTGYLVQYWNLFATLRFSFDSVQKLLLG